MEFHTLAALAFLLTCATLGRSQQFSFSDSLNGFGINLLAETVNQAGDPLNVALSTYTVWNLMSIIAEGSLENTARQLENTLKIPQDKSPLRKSFQNFSRTLMRKTDGVTLDLNTAIFTNKEFPVKKAFQGIAEQNYGVTLNEIDFKKPSDAAAIINRYIAQATRNRIPVFVIPPDLVDAQIFLTSVLYFKGQWKMPFNKSATNKESFYDEKGAKIGEVDMMYQAGIFPYSRIEEIRSNIVELPYGLDNKMSMVVILPFKGESVAGVLNLMSRIPFTSILKMLDTSVEEFPDDEVVVYLPRFKISSDFTLNSVLNKIGIKDVFESDKANLLGIFHHYLYLSRLIQKAEIEVNEEGTVASAASGGLLVNKSQPPRLKANKPFLYFIVDKETKTIVFGGKVSNPNTLK